MYNLRRYVRRCQRQDTAISPSDRAAQEVAVSGAACRAVVHFELRGDPYSSSTDPHSAGYVSLMGLRS